MKALVALPKLQCDSFTRILTVGGEVQRADLYRQFEQAAFPVSSVPDRADQT